MFLRMKSLQNYLQFLTLGKHRGWEVPEKAWWRRATDTAQETTDMARTRRTRLRGDGDVQGTAGARGYGGKGGRGGEGEQERGREGESNAGQ